MTDDNIVKMRQSIISKLTQARLEKGISQAQLAEMIGTQRSNICRIESGAQNLSLDMLIKISQALDKDVSVILSEKVNADYERYTLKLYDKPLIEFRLENKSLKGLTAEITWINKKKSALFPIDLKPTDEGILKWLRHRVISKNRQFAEEILKAYGLGVNNIKGIIDASMGLSLNDSYWVAKSDYPSTYSECCFYNNNFNGEISKIALTGVGDKPKSLKPSPELTTNGMLRKAWRYIKGDGIYLYKGGVVNSLYPGYEPFSEYYASQIAEVMGLNAVHYDLENWKGILASKCKIFTDIDTAFVPIGRLMKEGTLKAALDIYDEYGKEFREQVNSMLVFDALIFNEDRHFGNFGLLCDNHTGKVIAPAPIFDNGLSLFNFGMPDDFKNLAEYAKTRTNPYRISFEDVCREVMGTKQRNQLRKIVDFKFTRHPSINLPEERLTAIENYINVRARELLSLPKHI